MYKSNTPVSKPATVHPVAHQVYQWPPATNKQGVKVWPTHISEEQAGEALSRGYVTYDELVTAISLGLTQLTPAGVQ